MSLSHLQNIQFEKYELSHFISVRLLFERVWRTSRSIEYDDKYWNNTLVGVCPAVVAVSQGKVVGFYMIWPVLLTDGQREFVSGQPIDSMVDPDFQGRGLLRELGNRCYEVCCLAGMPVMYGTPNKAAYAGNVGALNWSHVSNVVDWVRPLIEFGGGRPDCTKQEGSWVWQRNERKKSIITVERNNSEKVSALWMNSVLPRRWQVSRSLAWMNYRYSSVPGAEYFTLTLLCNEAPVAVAICGFRKQGSRVRAWLAELAYLDDGSCRSVLAALASFARKKGARFLLAKTAPFDKGKPLLQMGFVPVRRTPLISRTLGWQCFAANALSKNGWCLFGGAFDLI